MQKALMGAASKATTGVNGLESIAGRAKDIPQSMTDDVKVNLLAAVMVQASLTSLHIFTRCERTANDH